MTKYLITCNPTFSKSLLQEVQDPKSVILYPGIILSDRLPVSHALVLAHDVYEIHKILEHIDPKTLAMEIAPLLSRQDSFALRCIIYGSERSNVVSLGMTSRDIEVQVGTLLEQQGYPVNLKQPGCVVYIHLIARKVYVGKMKSSMQRALVSKGNRLNRAQLKLREALTAFRIPLHKIKTALDIGAAPGGFTKELIAHNIKVTAIDPADLDISLRNDKNVAHLKIKAEEFSSTILYDLLVNDMNIHPKDSAKILLALSAYLKKGGYCLMTIKCPTKNVFYYIKEVKKILKPSFSQFAFKHLPHNRMEITMKAVK